VHRREGFDIAAGPFVQQAVDLTAERSGLIAELAGEARPPSLVCISVDPGSPDSPSAVTPGCRRPCVALAFATQNKNASR
jgi:hypothetical protein